MKMEKLEINIKSKTITGIFCEKESNEVVSELVLKILTQGEEKHENKCDHKKKCKGEQSYILKELQKFLNETPISNKDQIGVIAGVMFNLGALRESQEGAMTIAKALNELP